MQVIGFFRGFFDSIGGLMNFVNTPLKELNASLGATPIGDFSIFNMLSVGLVLTLVIFLAIHVVRLFIGG